MIHCVKNSCRAEGQQKCIGIQLMEDEEPVLFFQCKACGNRQKMTVSRFNELMESE